MRAVRGLLGSFFFISVICITALGDARERPDELVRMLPPGDLILDHFGYLYEDGGFPFSEKGDVLSGVGVVTAPATGIDCDLDTNELTWVIRGLVSESELSADGKTLVVNYSGGTIALYCDPSMNHDWGTDPPNAVAPSTFTDGELFLFGEFTHFLMMFDTQLQIGSYQGTVNFMGGANFAHLAASAPTTEGLVFAGTIGPGVDPNVPVGYDLEAVGRIIAPTMVPVEDDSCTVKGQVTYSDHVNYLDAELADLEGPESIENIEEGPVEGVTIELTDKDGNKRTTLTDEDGIYCFEDVPVPGGSVRIIVPLGYEPDGDVEVEFMCEGGDTAYVDFHLIRTKPVAGPRGLCFWRLEVNAALAGDPCHHVYSGEELQGFLDTIHERFDPFFVLYDDVNDLHDLSNLLDTDEWHVPFDNGRGQLMVLLLNVVSGRYGTWQVISCDGATVSQAISYCAAILTDEYDWNDGRAAKVAFPLNKGEILPAGKVPLDTPQIAFAPPAPGGRDGFVPTMTQRLGNYPNPFNPVTTIEYEVGAEATVSLAVFNVRGQKVRDLVTNRVQSGLNAAQWDGTDNSGRPVASGVYFSRLQVESRVLTHRMLLVR